MNAVTPLCSTILLLSAPFAAAQTPARPDVVPASRESDLKLPAKEDLHLFLLMGQSNMVGRGQLTQLPPHPRVLSFNRAMHWQLAVDPVHETSSRDRVGPGISFACSMLQVVDDRIAIGLIPCAVGGTPLSRWQRSGDLYETVIRRARAAMRQGTLRGVLWLHGERDAKQLETARTYGVRLTEMISDLRNDLERPNLAFVAGEMCEELSLRDDRTGAQLVTAAINALPANVAATACIDSAGLRSTGDYVHFSTRHQRKLGCRFAEKMAYLLEGIDVAIPPGYPWYMYHSSFEPPVADPKLPNVLLIGASNSMHYTPLVRRELHGAANVFRPPANCRSTRQTLRYLDQYLGDRKWDLIHFNWGMHDLTHLDASGLAAPPPTGTHQVPLDKYKRNLTMLLKRLQETGASLVWASTTPVGVRAEQQGFRRDQDVVAYNAAAAEACDSAGVPINDLYSLAKPRAGGLLSDGVHFNETGRAVLARAVADVIREMLPGGQVDHTDGADE